MNPFKKITATISLLLCTVFAFAQNTQMTDVQRAERTQQSVYIVMAVVVTIVIGLFIYLFTLDRKIAKLEKGN